MTTRVFGRSDDLIEVEGEKLVGEVGYFGTKHAPGVLLVLSDGTILQIGYGKSGRGIWAITLLRAGSLCEGPTDRLRETWCCR